MSNQIVRLFIVFLLALFTVNVTAQSGSDANGDIAFVTVEGNVAVLDVETLGETVLTSDGGAGRTYQFPTWSTDGRLAYFCCAQQSVEVFVSDDAVSPGVEIYTGNREAFTYAYWSPANCSDSDTCRELAVLLSRPGAPFKVQIIQDDPDSMEANSREVGSGVPYYMSWSPDGQDMLWFRNGSDLDIYSAAEDTVTQSLAVSPGFFQAAQWSPIDNRLLYGLFNDEANATDLVTNDNGEITTLDSSIPGLVSFNWSPDATKVAYRTLTNDGYSEIVVIDAITGAIVSKSSLDNVIAFFWSPDSQKIAYVTPELQTSGRSASQGPPTLIWSVLNTITNQDTPLTAFVPTDDLIYILTFFDQFAPSHRLWSPDSTRLTYADLTFDRRSRVNILDTTQTNAVPSAVAAGTISIWSFE